MAQENKRAQKKKSLEIKMASYEKKAITNALVNVAITGGAQIVHHTSGKDLAFQSDNVRKTTKRDTFLLHTAFRFASNFFFKANLDCSFTCC